MLIWVDNPELIFFQDQFQDQFPKATYMDDSIDSVETDVEDIELYQQLDALWKLAGMQARKWISNSPEVVAATPENDRGIELKLTDSRDGVVKTVGLAWNSKDDTLVIFSPECSFTIPLTKRNVLNELLFDLIPLHLLVLLSLLPRCYCKSYGLEATTGTMSL